MQTTISARIVLTTAATPEEAERIGRLLVEEQLVACATLIPAVRSIYRWQGNLETGAETQLLLKTSLDHLPALELRLHQIHSYQTPEFLVLAVESGTSAYLDWLGAALRPLR